MLCQTASDRKSTLLLTCTGSLSQLLGFFYRVALSRMIGAEVMGLYQLIMPVYSVLLSLTSVGLTVSLCNLGARYLALGNLRAVSQLRRRCLALFFLLALPLSAVVTLTSDPISVYVLRDARTQLGLILLLPCLLLTGVENLHKYYFYGTGWVKPPAIVELLEQVIRAGAVLGLLYCFLPQNPERTVGLIVTGMILCEIFSAVTLLGLYHSHMGPADTLKGEGASNSTLLQEISAVAFPVGATSLLGNVMGAAEAVLIPRQLEVMGLKASEALSAFGVLFGMTLPLLLFPSAFIGALGLVLTPRLAQNAALGRKSEVRRMLSLALQATGILITPAMAFLVVAGPSLGAFLFREPTVGEHILPLSVGVLLSCFQSVLSSSLNGLGLQRVSARSSLLSGAVQLLFIWFLVGIPGIGLSGFVAGLVVSSALGVLLNWAGVSAATGLKPQLFEWIVAPGLSALLAGLVINLLFRKLNKAGLQPGLAILSCILFGAVLYLAALQAQGALPPVRIKKRR